MFIICSVYLQCCKIFLCEKLAALMVRSWYTKRRVGGWDVTGKAAGLTDKGGPHKQASQQYEMECCNFVRRQPISMLQTCMDAEYQKQPA